jgi:hypothetical protein
VNHHDEHAWPNLLPKLLGDGNEAWRNRVTVAHDEARPAREKLRRDLGFGKPIAPGADWPVRSEELERAEDLVEVLEWRLGQIPSDFDEPA